jgi:predicted amidohydrolase YtcJ
MGRRRFSHSRKLVIEFGRVQYVYKPRLALHLLQADFERSPKLKDLPIALSRIDIHAEWISQPILSLLPALPETVEGGKIIRFSNGSATGVFLDDAMNLIDLVRPQWTETQMEGFLKRTVNDAVKVGVTGIHDAYGLPEHIEFYQR